MYFEIDENHPDISPVGSVMSWREGVLVSLVIHLLLVILAITSPQIFRVDPEVAKKQEELMLAKRQEEPEKARFVFVQPLRDLPAEKPPERADLSDADRRLASPKPKADNPLPQSQGNTRERVERSEQEVAKGQGPSPEPLAGQETPQPPQPETPPQPEPPKIADAQPNPFQQPPQPPSPRSGALGRATQSGGSLGEALRNLQKYVQRDQFDNAQGGGAFGPAIQFDTKGVEFGPWIRRFVAQVKRNWLIPYAAMSMKGHVVVTFNVHKDGTITDLQVVGPSPVDAFNNAAFGALATSNPTAPLPPEYPADKAFFTVTFFYNEEPQ